jgi:hypothetical protein
VAAHSKTTASRIRVINQFRLEAGRTPPATKGAAAIGPKSPAWNYRIAT